MLLDAGILAWLKVDEFLLYSAREVEQSPSYINIALGNFVYFVIEIRGVSRDEVDSIASDE